MERRSEILGVERRMKCKHVLLKHFPIRWTQSLRRRSLAHPGHRVYNRVTFVPQRAHMPSAVSRCPGRDQAPSAGKVTPVCQRRRSGAGQDGQYRQWVSKKTSKEPMSGKGLMFS